MLTVFFPDVCNLPKDSGPCCDYSLAFYHDSSGDKCEPFVYGGCDGNQNRFSSMLECQQRCSPSDSCDGPKGKELL